MNNFYRVKSQSETFFVQSQKAEGGQVSMCNVVLQELGGKFENQYVATIFGEQARIRFELNDLVAASLRFSTREYNGQTYLAVTPATDENDADVEVSILKSVEEDGEPILCAIEDEAELEAVHDILMDSLYEEESEE